MSAVKTGSRFGKLAGLMLAGTLAFTALSAAPAQAANSSVTVKGHVYSPSKKGVGNVVVTVYYRTPSVGQYLTKKTRTSSTGRYELKVPKSFDTYKIKANDPGDNDRDMADGKWAPTLIGAFRSSSTVIKRDLNVSLGARLSGRIYDRSGKPASGLKVYAVGVNQLTNPSTYTRSNGAYYFKNLRPDEVTVLAESPSSNGLARYYVKNDSSGALNRVEASRVAVESGKNTPSNSIYFPSVSKITGRVTVDGAEPFGEGGNSVSTVLYDSAGKRLYEAFTNPTFKFKDLPAGTYYLGFESVGEPVVAEFYADKNTLTEATPITVRSGGAVGGIVASLASAPTAAS